MAYIKSFFRR